MRHRVGAFLVLAVAWLAGSSLPAFAQVDRVVVEAVKGDIDCLPCAATIEMALRQLGYVDKVAVSMSKQMVAVTFKPGAQFDPKAIRDAIAKAEVRVDKMHISARGVAKDENGKVFFVAEKNRFLVPSSKLPTNVSIGIMAAVDDSKSPLELTVDDFKPAAP
jgi:copper chaperone CopZ